MKITFEIPEARVLDLSNPPDKIRVNERIYALVNSRAKMSLQILGLDLFSLKINKNQ